MKSKRSPVKKTVPESEPPKGKKLFLFRLFSVLTPFLLIILLEFFLRICNYGINTDLFVKFPPDDRYMVMNYDAADKFFPDTTSATRGNQEIFAINKAPNTFRVFVLGESTTIGYPFRPNGSFHRWLQYRLMKMYPDKNFEIINLSLTAVNSYTVLDFGKQLAQYQPDAVLIYVGHNEYYGALGIGSTTYVGSNRFLVQALIKLRGFKTVQLFNNCIKSIAGIFASKPTGDRQSLMEVMASRQHIVYGSADCKAGIDQFNTNMTELCRTLNDEKIPTFLSTVVSNEKDLPPFVSDGTGPGSATGYYNAGMEAYKSSKFDTAKQDFDKAKELDELRFRAPAAINTSINKIATQFPFVHLVDTKKMFEEQSPHGIIGSETIMEHVHPTLFGYSIMSEAFYRAMQKQQLIKDKPDVNMSFDELRKEMPVTRMDSLMGAYAIMMLKTGWPFNQPISKQFKVENSIEATLAVKISLGHIPWVVAMGQLYQYDIKHNNNAEAVKVAEGLVLQYPHDKGFYAYAGNANIAVKDYAQAAFYYKKAYMIGNDLETAETVFKLYLKANEPAKALPYAPQQAQATLMQLINDKALLKNEPGNTQAIERMAANYKAFGIDTAFSNVNK